MISAIWSSQDNWATAASGPGIPSGKKLERSGIGGGKIERLFA
jgi:hypothetical protein